MRGGAIAAVLGVLAAASVAGVAGAAPAQAPDRIAFTFSAYGNPQRPFPGYVGPFQLGPVRISGSGEIRGKDGAITRGGTISHTDNLKDRRYPNHVTTWKVVRGLSVKSEGPRTLLRLQVQVTASSYPDICPVGTLGVLELIDDTSTLANGQSADHVRTTMPSPSSQNQKGTLACGTHTHGFNNVDYTWTEPPRGGPGGGIWANVKVGGVAQTTWTGTWHAVYRFALGPMTLTQSGSTVTGRYTWTGGGTIKGRLDSTGKSFTGTYTATSGGRATLKMTLSGTRISATSTSPQGDGSFTATCISGPCLKNSG